MKIIEALKSSDSQLRINNVSRWLVFDVFYNGFIVYEHKRYAKKTTIIIKTGNEDEAVAVLTEE